VFTSAAQRHHKRLTRWLIRQMGRGDRDLGLFGVLSQSAAANGR